MRILSRLMAREYLRTALGTLVGLCAISLVIEYVDRSKFYTGHAWVRWVLELYFWRGLLVAQELAPAALVLAAALQLAVYRRRSELTAMSALSIGPLRMLLPFATVAALVIGGMVLADETVMGHASQRVDEINATRFKRTSDWRKYFSGAQWFRGAKTIYRLRAAGDESFFNVTLFSVSEKFRLTQRVDAREMRPLPDGTWELLDGVERKLDGERSEVEKFERKVMALEEKPSAFRIAKGRPEQMRFGALREQRELRRQVGLPIERHTYALHNKLALPLGALPGVLIACAIALRANRRSTMAAAAAQGFTIIAVLWMLSVIFKAAGLSGTFSPVVAAWLPSAILVVFSSVFVARAVR